MDDRTFVERTPDTLLDRKQAWEQWSIAHHLKENASKAQVSAATAEKQEELREAVLQRGLPEEIISPTLEVLGGSTPGYGANTVYTKKERSRLTEATTIAHTIAVAPLPTARKRRYQKMFAISKANYGWITKAPNQTMLHPMQRAINRHTRHARANPMLSQILETDLELSAKIHIRTFMVLARRIKKNPQTCAWNRCGEGCNGARCSRCPPR